MYENILKESFTIVTQAYMLMILVIELDQFYDSHEVCESNFSI